MREPVVVDPLPAPIVHDERADGLADVPQKLAAECVLACESDRPGRCFLLSRAPERFVESFTRNGVPRPALQQVRELARTGGGRPADATLGGEYGAAVRAVRETSDEPAWK